MTSKKQAQELFDEFYDAVDQHWNQVPVAKQCALIAVDEIIKYQDSLVGMLDTNDGRDIMFWEEVKKEIEQL